MVDFGVSADDTSMETEYEVHDENFLADFVEFSRDNQVLNEEQSAVVMMAIATGLLPDHEYFTSAIVTGAASGGKSHMLNEVIFESLEYADNVHEWVYELTGGSDQAGINDPEIDDSRILYFHELQKIPDEMLEFVKTIAEDGTFRYGRSQADSDADGGFTTDHIERDPAPVIFSFADENTAEAGKDQELRSRMVEVKVDSGPEKNSGVHDMKWGGEQISIPSSDHDYIRNGKEATDRAHAVKSHIRDAPTDVDVTIPYGNGKFEGDDWCAAEVVKPMFNFAREESTRASANLAGLTKGSALLNYHSRRSVCERCGTSYGPDEAQSMDYECDCDEDADLVIVANETDVGNIIACRPTLLATTHGLTEKKFAVLDAIRERGGRADASGTKLQATKGDVVDYIQDNDDIATLTKNEITTILDDLDEHLIINTKDNPEDRRENLYVYDGSEVFEPPAVHDHYERFRDVTDPIKQQPIEDTIDDHLEDLNAKTTVGALGEHSESRESDESGSLSDFSGDSDGRDVDVSEAAQKTAERLEETVDGTVIPAEVMDESSLKVGHLVGDTPIETETDGGDVYVTPKRPPRGDDRIDGFMSPETFEDASDMSDAESAVESAVTELKEAGVLRMERRPNGDVDVSVSW